MVESTPTCCCITVPSHRRCKPCFPFLLFVAWTRIDFLLLFFFGDCSCSCVHFEEKECIRCFCGCCRQQKRYMGTRRRARRQSLTGGTSTATVSDRSSGRALLSYSVRWWRPADRLSREGAEKSCRPRLARVFRRHSPPMLCCAFAMSRAALFPETL